MKKLLLTISVVMLSICVYAQNPKKIADKAYDMWSVEKYDEAISLLKQCLEKKFYLDGNVYYLLTESYLSLEQNDKAIIYGEEGARMFPENKLLLDILFMAYYFNNDLKCVDVGNKLLDLGAELEKQKLYLSYMGLINVNSGNYEESIVYAKKALEIDPNDDQCNLCVGYAMYYQFVPIMEKFSSITQTDSAEYQELQNKCSQLAGESYYYLEEAFKTATGLQTKLQAAEILSYYCSIFQEQEYKEKEAYYTKFVESGGNM